MVIMSKRPCLDLIRDCGTIRSPVMAELKYDFKADYFSQGHQIADHNIQADSVFSGISTFGRLPYHPCLADDSQKFDIAFIGICSEITSSYYQDADHA